MKQITLIKSEVEYHKTLDMVELLFDKKVKKNSEQGRMLELLLLIIKDYEDKHHAVPLPDAIETIKTVMKERGLKAKDLSEALGSKSYISQILNKHKPMTADIMKYFYKHLGIPPVILLS